MNEMAILGGAVSQLATSLQDYALLGRNASGEDRTNEQT